MPLLQRLSRIAPCAALLGIAATAAGQAAPSGTVLHVSPYAGYVVSSDYFKGPIGTSLTNSSGPLYGAQVGLSMSPTISLVGNLAYSTGSIQVGVPFLGGISVGNTSMLIYDGSVQLDLPTSGKNALGFLPFVQAGVGAILYEIDESLLHTNATNAALNLGLGADVALGRGLALRLLAKDYIGKFDFKEATSFDI